jgi:hypothetical protein
MSITGQSQMKTSFIFLIIVIAILIGCTGPTSPGSGNHAAIPSLVGQIDAWKYGGDRHIILVAPDSPEVAQICNSKIDLAGDFSLQYLGPPPTSAAFFPSYFLLPGLGQEIIENTLACSDSSAMIISGQLFLGNDSSSSWLGYVTRESRSVNLFGTIGDFRANYYYASKEVNLTGTIKIRDFFGSDSVGLEQIYQYDLFFVKGWNEEVKSITSQSVYTDSGKTITSFVYSYTNEEPAGGKWIYIGN